ncbi:restriction endonuclease [Pseudomonas prosekii]|uniref:Eco29kI family restriction endonuclease n=1 Tax=Pseudomonas prosekii TaxID=1148509 RepID=UPI000D617157|nr:Eco29kI family restriction endonuclease [Pseudomonas prosekii]PWE38568.1 restriction endonuclease [Pseudomonas prosekii]
MANKMPTTEFEALLVELRNLTQRLINTEVGENVRTIKKARSALDDITDRLTDISTALDPIRRPTSIFDPTDPSTAGRIVALTLVAQDRHPLAAVPSFYGAGVYAIYYSGKFDPYQALAGTEHPIYVGKADPDASAAKDAVSQGPKVSLRLQEHAKNIGKAGSTLCIEDFECRFLIVQTGFQKSAEDYLIKFFKPIWNSETKICFGLGKHGDSASTRANKRSPWDTLHPGRKWADSSEQNQKPYELILDQIANHFVKNPAYINAVDIYDHFMSDMRQLNPELDKAYLATQK